MSTMLTFPIHLLTFFSLVSLGPMKGGQGHINNERKYRCEEWPSDKYEPLGQYGNKCFTRSTAETTWEGANDSCSNNDGRLVKIPSPDVYTTVISNFRYGERGCYWIGATDKGEEGSWKWTDGSKVLFHDWDLGVLDTLLGWMQDCAAICHPNLWTDDLTWSKLVCRVPWGFICEYDADQISVVSEETEVATSFMKPPKKVFAQVPCGNSIRLLYKPDMKTSAPKFLLCARKCLESLNHCSIFNYNSVTKECVGFSSPDVLKQAKERNENWKIWKVST